MKYMSRSTNEIPNDWESVEHLIKVTDMLIIYLLNMLELDIGLVDGGESNFDASFLQFNVKKK